MRNRVPCRWSVRGSRIVWRSGTSTGPDVRPPAQWRDEPTATGPRGHRRPSVKVPAAERQGGWRGAEALPA